jgi:hypothetical protein
MHCGIFLKKLFILEKYTIVSKFSKSDHQPSWRTKIARQTAVGHGGCRCWAAAGSGYATRLTAVGHDGWFFNLVDDKTHTFAMACRTLLLP